MQRNLCIKLIESSTIFFTFYAEESLYSADQSSTIFFMFYAEESLYSADRKFYHIFHVLCRGIFVFS